MNRWKLVPVYPIPVVMEDEPIHTDDRPFCSIDPTCPCHSDPDLLAMVEQWITGGLMTQEEAAHFIAGDYPVTGLQYKVHAMASCLHSVNEKEDSRTHAAIYARIDSIVAEPSASDLLALQVQMCQQYCQEHGYTVAAHHIYQEVERGADLLGRPTINALCSSVQRGEITLLVVTSLDRLVRDYPHAVSFVNELKANGLTVVSLDEQCPLSSDPFQSLWQVYQTEMEEEEHWIAACLQTLQDGGPMVPTTLDAGLFQNHPLNMPVMSAAMPDRALDITSL